MRRPGFASLDVHKLAPLEVSLKKRQALYLAVALVLLGIIALPVRQFLQASLDPGSSRQTPRDAPQENTGQPRWRDTLEQAREESRSSGLPMMIDFFADWCAPCLELERVTFQDPKAREVLSRFIPVRIDLSHDSAQNNKYWGEFDLDSLPAILFLSSRGEEVPASRIKGYIMPAPFVAHLKKVLSNLVDEN